MFGYDPAAKAKAAPADEAPEAEAPEKKESGEVVFPAPKGFSVSGRQPGDTFEALAQLKIKPDGSLCLEALDGVPLAAYDDDYEESEDDGSFMSAVERSAAV